MRAAPAKLQKLGHPSHWQNRKTLLSKAITAVSFNSRPFLSLISAEARRCDAPRGSFAGLGASRASRDASARRATADGDTVRRERADVLLELLRASPVRRPRRLVEVFFSFTFLITII